MTGTCASFFLVHLLVHWLQMLATLLLEQMTLPQQMAQRRYCQPGLLQLGASSCCSFKEKEASCLAVQITGTTPVLLNLPVQN